MYSTLFAILGAIILLIGIVAFFVAVSGDGESGPPAFGVFIFIICALGLWFGYVCYSEGEAKTQQAAVIAGAGHYVTVVKDGIVSNEFVWGPAPK